MEKRNQVDALQHDSQRIADALERGEIPEDVPVEDAPASERRLEQRKSKTLVEI